MFLFASLPVSIEQFASVRNCIIVGTFEQCDCLLLSISFESHLIHHKILCEFIQNTHISLERVPATHKLITTATVQGTNAKWRSIRQLPILSTSNISDESVLRYCGLVTHYCDTTAFNLFGVFRGILWFGVGISPQWEIV